MLIKKALHIVTDATDLIYYPFRTWGFILMVRDLLLEDYYSSTMHLGLSGRAHGRIGQEIDNFEGGWTKNR